MLLFLKADDDELEPIESSMFVDEENLEMSGCFGTMKFIVSRYFFIHVPIVRGV